MGGYRATANKGRGLGVQWRPYGPRKSAAREDKTEEKIVVKVWGRRGCNVRQFEGNAAQKKGLH